MGEGGFSEIGGDKDRGRMGGGKEQGWGGGGGDMPGRDSLGVGLGCRPL